MQPFWIPLAIKNCRTKSTNPITRYWTTYITSFTDLLRGLYPKLSWTSVWYQYRLFSFFFSAQFLSFFSSSDRRRWEYKRYLWRFLNKWATMKLVWTWRFPADRIKTMDWIYISLSNTHLFGLVRASPQHSPILLPASASVYEGGAEDEEEEEEGLCRV